MIINLTYIIMMQYVCDNTICASEVNKYFYWSKLIWLIMHDFANLNKIKIRCFVIDDQID